MTEIVKFLRENIKSEVLENEPMKNHTSFKVGGEADIFINISNVDDLVFCLKTFKEKNIPFYIIGNGCNTLVSDEGVRGAVICIYSEMNKVTVDGCILEALAGTPMTTIALLAKNECLTGFEFASGIPGTIGGGLAMNAGAYGGELKDVVLSAKVLDNDYNIIELSNEELKFDYRKSIISEKKYIVLSTKIKLEKGNFDDIDGKMKELSQKRREKQPLEFPSAGSTFKRPVGYFAGKLIQDSGLKGCSVGGACVSEKHSGFIINKGNATASDIYKLIKHCQKEVYNNFNVNIETEVKLIGDFE